MRKTVLLYLILFLSIGVYSQTNQEIANVYFKKAEEAIGKIDFSSALENFNKGIGIIDEVQRPRIAHMGTFINYELKMYDDAMLYAKKYFSLSPSNSSDDYNQMLEMYAFLQERFSQKEQERRKKEAERLKKEKEKLEKEKELKKIDSLKTEWQKLSKNFILEVDSIHKFNKRGITIYKKGRFYGVINDKGNIIKKAEKYRYAFQNEGYIVLLDKKNNTRRGYIYEVESDEDYELPPAYRFDKNSSYYSKVTLPRGNGRMVLYPESSLKTIVYDIGLEKPVEIANIKDLFRQLRKEDKIDKSDRKERTVKVNKDWYSLGNYLGGGVYSLYVTETKEIYGFLITNVEEDYMVLKYNDVGYLGAFYKNKLQAIKGNKTTWITDIGEEGSKPKSDYFDYDGGVEVEKIENGKYHLKKNGSIFLKGKTLNSMADYLRKNK